MVEGDSNAVQGKKESTCVWVWFEGQDRAEQSRIEYRVEQQAEVSESEA